MKLGDREDAPSRPISKTLDVDPNYLSARAKLDMLVAEARNESN